MDDGHAPQLELFLLPQGMQIEEFRPTVLHDKPSDALVYLEQDCSNTEEPCAGSNIVLLRSHKTGNIIGVRVGGYTSLRKDL